MPINSCSNVGPLTRANSRWNSSAPSNSPAQDKPRQDVLAGASAAVMLGIPGAGASITLGGIPHDMLNVAAADVGCVAVESDGSGLDQGGGVSQTRMHPCQAFGVIGQFPMKVSPFGGVVAHSTRCAQTSQCGGDPALIEAGFGCQPGNVDPWLEGQERGDQVGVIRGSFVGEIPQHPSFAGIPSAGFGTEREHQTGIIQFQLPQACRALRIVGCRVRAERSRKPQERFECFEAVGSRERNSTGSRAGRET